MRLTTDELHTFLTTELGLEDDVTAETELFSTGMLDSVAMMNIIGFIEEKSGIDVRPADVTLDNFDTMQRIVDYVAAES
ncbi:acyl carrier protein [Seohaeicola saemankumensis]|uniref:acyl carrier protein n=1 Tax=Seohaeicola saemankumensis TaxID=481181 RepID=UPI001E55F157|nr:acyl carrier protein [Seohaeicola saemankumensis]MCD1627361.1 acyl carrier protein [Seohaeicola saemankumensis]